MKLNFLVLMTNAWTFVAVANADGFAWDDLSEDQKDLLADHADTWDRMDDVRQEQIATGAERWLVMTQAE